MRAAPPGRFARHACCRPVAWLPSPPRARPTVASRSGSGSSRARRPAPVPRPAPPQIPPVGGSRAAQAAVWARCAAKAPHRSGPDVRGSDSGPPPAAPEPHPPCPGMNPLPAPWRRSRQAPKTHAGSTSSRDERSLVKTPPGKAARAALEGRRPVRTATPRKRREGFRRTQPPRGRLSRARSPRRAPCAPGRRRRSGKAPCEAGPHARPRSGYRRRSPAPRPGQEAARVSRRGRASP
jgi:hypothetical protein